MVERLSCFLKDFENGKHLEILLNIYLKNLSMKKIILAALLFNLTLAATAQDQEPEKEGGFKKEKLFTGGNVIASFYTGGTVLGVSPHFGYSLTNWLDAAVSLNFIYTGERDRYDNKIRQTSFGPGAFVRIFPIKSVFTK
jgi:hypothetical protein